MNNKIILQYTYYYRWRYYVKVYYRQSHREHIIYLFIIIILKTVFTIYTKSTIIRLKQKIKYLVSGSYTIIF